MAKSINALTPTLFQNYQDNPIYQWYHEELWHIHLDLSCTNIKINSAKELYWRAKQIELRDVLEDRLKTFLERELQFKWGRAKEIVEAIKDAEFWERGGQGKEARNA